MAMLIYIFVSSLLLHLFLIAWLGLAIDALFEHELELFERHRTVFITVEKVENRLALLFCHSSIYSLQQLSHLALVQLVVCRFVVLG